MIYDSFIWKRELKKELNNFRKLTAKMELSEEIGIPDDLTLKIEKFFFVSVFIVRKLNEAKRLSDELNALKIPVVKYKRIDKDRRLDLWNSHHIDEFYDLEKGSDSSLSLTGLCNNLIHSFIFQVVVGTEATQKNEKIVGILVNSDYSKDKELYYLEIDDFYSILEETIKDDVVHKDINRITGKVINSRYLPHDTNSSRQALEQFFKQLESDK